MAACALVLAFGWATLIQPTALFSDPHRIVDVQASRIGGGQGSRHAVYPADFLAWRESQGAFALLALALAAVGLYSLLADAVVRRRREIGIRIALGAGKGQVAALLTRPTARLILVGLATGVALSVGFTRWLASRIEGVLPDGGTPVSDLLPAGTAATALLLLAVTLAIAPPIRRALRTEARDVLSE